MYCTSPLRYNQFIKANTQDKTLQGYTINCLPNLGKTISLLLFSCGSAESVFPKLLVLVQYLYNFFIVLVWHVSYYPFISLKIWLIFDLCVCSVVSDSLWPHGLKPTRLFCPQDSPGKNTGVGCHCLLQQIFWPREPTFNSYVSCTGR